MNAALENALKEYVRELRAAQDAMRDFLDMQREALLSPAPPGAPGAATQKPGFSEKPGFSRSDAVHRMEECRRHRAELLAQAAAEGLPGRTIEQLVVQVSPAARESLALHVADAKRAGIELRHRGWTNWVVAQRMHLHLTQLLNLIAGAGPVTYGSKMDHNGSTPARPQGAMVDAEA